MRSGGKGYERLMGMAGTMVVGMTASAVPGRCIGKQLNQQHKLVAKFLHFTCLGKNSADILVGHELPVVCAVETLN